MRFLLLYKGHYNGALRGPEMRYVAVADQLISSGHEVVICGKAGGDSISDAVQFVAVSRVFRLLRAFLNADIIVLHGGGPVVLAFAFISALCGRKIVLDSYVPHWIELDAMAGSSGLSLKLKLLVKTYFNAVRCFSAGLLFDFIIVANKRQLDLHRGMMFPFQLTRDFSRVSVIPFGCEESRNCSRADGRRLMSELGGVKLGDDDFLVGWLGGTYGWFDLELPLRAASEAICRNSQIKLIFFGVDKAYREKLLEYVTPAARDNIIFLPWVDFSRRFQYWSGFDVSLVWGGEGYENDYASRTRNFDCLSLSLPIIQNYDDEWGERLRASGGGVIADQSSLAEGIYRLSKDQGTLAAMRKSMAELAGGFYWRKFTDSLLQQVAQPAMSLGRRMVGFLAMLAVLPAVFVFFVFSSLTIFLERWSSNNEA